MKFKIVLGDDEQVLIGDDKNLYAKRGRGYNVSFRWPHRLVDNQRPTGDWAKKYDLWWQWDIAIMP